MPIDGPSPVPQQDSSYFRHVRTEIAPFLPANFSTILEIGCGAGGTMAWLRSLRSIDYAAGVELSGAAAAVAQAEFDDIEVSDVGMAKLEFRHDRFDVVLALDVLEHLADPWSVLHRLRSMMAPDGILIASIPNVAHYKVSLPLLLRGQWNYTNEGLLDRTHLRFFTRDTVMSLFEESGFSVQKFGRNLDFPHLFGLFGLSGQRWRWYGQRVMSLLLPWPSRFFTIQFLIAARPAAVTHGDHNPVVGTAPSRVNLPGCQTPPKSQP
jgi:SAM-dependent methyltransferase